MNQLVRENLYYGENNSANSTYTYAYNEDGICTQKNSDGILTSYYYNGSLLIGMTVGSGSSTNILRFSYDAVTATLCKIQL